MSDKGSIEDIFRRAASEVEKAPVSSPPPTADWSSMSSSLKESAVIKAGGGATKLAAVKAIGSKISLKVATIAIVSSGAVGTAVVLSQSESSDKNNSNPAIQNEMVLEPNETKDDIENTTIEIEDFSSNSSDAASETQMESVQNVAGQLSSVDNVKGNLKANNSSRSQTGVSKTKENPESDLNNNSTSNSNLANSSTGQGQQQEYGVPSDEKPSGVSVGVTSSTGEATAVASSELANPVAGEAGQANVNVSQALNEKPSEANSTSADIPNKDSDQESLTSNSGDQSIAEVTDSNVPVPAESDEDLANETPQKVSGMDSIENTLDKPGDIALDESAEAVMASSAVQKRAMERDKFRWMFRPYFAMDLTDYRVGNNNLVNSVSNLGTGVDINSGPFNFTAGVLAAYHLAPYLWIESGALYSQKNQITGRLGLLDQNFVLNKVVDYQLSGKYFEIPVNLLIKDNNGVFGWYGKAGFHMSFSYSESSNFVDVHDFETIRTIRVEPSLETFIPVINVGAGIEYNLSNTLRIYAEPSFRFSTKPVLNATEVADIPVNPKWSTFGLGLGINYYID